MNIAEQLATLSDGNIALIKAAIVLIVTLVFSLLSRVVVARLKQFAGRTANPWDDAFIQSVGPPLRLLLWTAGVSIALELLQVKDNTLLQEVLGPARDLAVITAITWFAIRFINQSARIIADKYKDDGKEYDEATLSAVAKISRLVVFVAAILVAMQTMGFSIAGVLTFGGVGGVAVGFAAKDLLSNFFGGLIVYLDRPFSEGDWILSPDREIEGTVESIGWRVTRIRKFDSQPLYVPNSAFATITIENPSRMNNRRIYETIGIRYEDADAMEVIVKRIDQFLRTHPALDQEQTIMVNFAKFAPSSLDLFVYCFTRTCAWAEFNNVKQEILLGVLNIIKEEGAQCAFPTATVHLDGHIMPPR